MLDPIVNFFTRVFQWIGRGIGFLIGIILWPFMWAGRWYTQRGWILKSVLGLILAAIVLGYAYFFYVTQFWKDFDPDYPSAVVAGAAGARQLAFAVSLSRAFSKSVRVNYTITAGTAVWNKHYSGAPSGTLTIPAGTTTVFKTVTIKANKTLNSAKTMRITLSGLRAPSNTKLLRKVATGTILPN